MGIKYYSFITEIGFLIMIVNINIISVESDLIVIEQDDPSDNYKGTTYDYLNFMSEIRTSEINLVEGTSDCTGSCSNYKNHLQFSNHDYINKVYTEYCDGHLRDCRVYKDAEDSNIASGFFSFFNDLDFFFNDNFENYFENSARIKQATCPTCKCYCDDAENSTLTRSFCLDVISSNAAERYVVTGVRFRIQDNIVRVQIQEGRLLNSDVVDSSTLKWQELDKCAMNEMMSYDNRSLQMDDIILGNTSIVTGVSFRKNKDTGMFYFSVYGKPINDINNVNINSTEYSKPFGKRTNLLTANMDIPTAFLGKNEDLSQPDKHYITFQAPVVKSNSDKSDNQVMPFLDIRDVVSGDKMKPLRGLGIYWRSHDDYGGYVAFKLFI